MEEAHRKQRIDQGDRLMLTRRACIVGASAAALAPIMASNAREQAGETDQGFDPSSPLPHKAAFSAFAGSYLNCASQHPLSIGARDAINRYMDFKTFAAASDHPVFATYQRNLENYARLINADKDEICFVCIVGASAAALASIMASNARGKAGETDQEFDPSSPLPHKAAFSAFAGSYLNCASQHPLSIGARDAINRYMDFKTFAAASDHPVFATYQRNLENYARLINADKDEICFVQRTTVGENLVLKALNIPEAGGRIVTDELHYMGSLPTYAEIANQGMDIVTLRSSDGTIDMDEFEKAVTPGTRLVTVSSVSMVNGFQHDLSRICEIAHAAGALVYADIVHQVGSTPIDVRVSGVDFCSAASYKWLMGEQGLGFLYARRDRLAQIERPWLGHYQL